MLHGDISGLTPREILKKYWGYDSFRPMQESIIENVLDGKDVLGLMPTGGGKSITFQVPALMFEGLTVVVTPLVSLMKDQVDNLSRRHVRAVYLHSGMTATQSRIAWEKLSHSPCKLLFVSPERLSNRRFLDNIRQMKVSFIVVDEAHCISQWGYDFRPHYLRISTLRKIFPSARLLALTATATPSVAEDICSNLEMRDPVVLRMSFSRQNISYIVRQADIKINDVVHILSRTAGSAIVYVRSRKRTREIAESLTAVGISATFYHAGLDNELKEKRQNEWQRGIVRVIVATNAFGMGIDKPDVRTVIHYDLPPSIEEYYQEAGRAGRDGNPSYAVLLINRDDRSLLRRRVTETFPDKKIIRRIYERVGNYLHIALEEGYDRLYEFNPDDFCKKFSYQPRQFDASMAILGNAGYMQFVDETESRSRVMIIVTREELYHLHSEDSKVSDVLKSLLRMYPGIFADYVFIKEETLALNALLDQESLYHTLVKLSKQGVISYIPRSRTPYIYMPTSREEPEHVAIPKSVYELRKEVMTRRTEAMINYAFSGEGCRENMMVRYFGETPVKPCGHCDLCRSASKRMKRDMSGGNPAEAVMQYIGSSSYPASIQILRRAFPDIDEKELARLLSHLCSEGFITLLNGHYSLPQKK